jgi:hemin uptake protein HemP
MASNASPASDRPPTANDVPPTPVARPVPGPACIDSAALFGSAVEVQIVHRGTLYRLRQTALGKLILTK